MNNNIILAALQTQLETVKANAVAHEENVYNPSLSKLQSRIAEWFHNNVATGINDVTISSDRITIQPNDDTSYGSTITIDYRGGWRGDNAYFETSAYRPDLKSNEDNTKAIFYYNVMSMIANKFSSICDKYKNSWMPAYNKLEAAKSEKYNEIYNIEREIRTIESQIAETEKEVYNQVGFECTLKPYTNYDSNYGNNECVYTKKYDEHHIKAMYGRSKWDYAYVHSFKVVSFPKSKFGKVILEWKGNSTDEKPRTVELNKKRYAEFVDAVYQWQNFGAAEREANIDERIERWSAKQTA